MIFSASIHCTPLPGGTGWAAHAAPGNPTAEISHRTLCFRHLRSPLVALYLQGADIRNGEGTVQIAQTRVDGLDRKLAKERGDLDLTAEDNSKKVQAETDLEQSKVDAAYADGIQTENLPIFLLNVTLVLTAISSAYFVSSGRVARVKKTPSDVERLQSLQAKIAAKQAEVREMELRILGTRSKVRELDSSIRTNLGRARYLANSSPFRDCEAKANRLEGIIPLFRAENARLRGLDTHNVVAFQQKRPLDLVPMGEGETFKVPEELAELEREYSEVRCQVLEALSITADTIPGVLV